MPPPPVPSQNVAESIAKQSPWPGGTQPPQIGGPKVFTPGQQIHTMDIPDFLARGSVRPGYQEAHELYDEMRTYFARRAFTSNNFELVVVKVMMMWMKPGNKNPSIVSVRAYIYHPPTPLNFLIPEYFGDHQ